MVAEPGPSIAALRGAVDLSPLLDRAAARQTPANPQSSSEPSGHGTSANGSAAATTDDSAEIALAFSVGDADFGRVVELSKTVPVLVALTASWSTPSGQLVEALTRAVQSYGGRIVLAIVDTDTSPQIQAAFQAQSIPTTAAVIAGQPLPLFTGAASAEQLGPLLDQVLQAAAQYGVTGSIAPAEQSTPPDGEAAQPAEQPLPPHHAAAYEAIDRGDYEAAAREFRTAIAQDPRDTQAVAALAQVELLQRLAGADAGALRAAAAAAPDDLAAALAVGDLDVSGGHLDDAFDRVLELFPHLPGEAREAARARLLSWFQIAGADDPRVTAARRRLAALLY